MRPVAKTLARRPKSGLSGRLACQPQPAERAKSLTATACNLSPKRCLASTLWTRTQRPRVLMTTVGRHLHTGALGVGPTKGRAACHRMLNLFVPKDLNDRITNCRRNEKHAGRTTTQLPLCQT